MAICLNVAYSSAYSRDGEIFWPTLPPLNLFSHHDSLAVPVVSHVMVEQIDDWERNCDGWQMSSHG